MADDTGEPRLPWYEADRLAALRKLAVLDTPAEPAFDDVVALVQAICDVPVALVSLVDSDRQWFKAKAGTDIAETGLDNSVCAIAIRQRGVLEIRDLTRDPRTQAMGIVTSDPHVRFYAGVPLVTSEGFPIGSLCAIDVAPRPGGLTDRQRIALEALGREVVVQLELRAELKRRDPALPAAHPLDDPALLETMVHAQRSVIAAGGQIDAIMQALVAGTLRSVPAADGVVVEVRDGEEMVYRHAVGTAAAEIGLRFPIEGSLSGRSLREGRTIVAPDAPNEPGGNRALIERLGMRSILVVPLFRHREPLGVLKLHALQPDAFGSREVLVAQLLAGLIATGFAEGDETFLLALTTILRDDQGDQGLEAASALIGAHFGVSRVGFGEFDVGEGMIDHDVCWTDGSIAPLPARRAVDMLGPDSAALLERGEPVAIADAGRGADVTATLVVPVSKRGARRRILHLDTGRPRHWTSADIALVEEIGLRILQVIERRAAETALRASDASWHDLFQQLDEGFFVGEAVRDGAGAVVDWRFVQVNAAFLELSDRVGAPVIGRLATEVAHPVRNEAIERVARVVTHGGTEHFDLERKGRRFAGRTIRIDGDRFAAVFSDVTEGHHERRRQIALLALTDELGAIGEPAEVALRACALLGRTLGVARVGYGEIDKRAETILVQRDWNAPGVTSIAGMLRFRDYGSYIDDLNGGETVAIADVRLDERTRDGAAALEAIAARSFVNMPVTEHGDAVALFFVNHDVPRDWTADLPLVREFAERTRTAVERRRAEQQLMALTASLEEEVEQRTADLLLAEEQLRQSQKMEAVGQLTGGLAHDFNNMLAGISGALEMIQVRVAQGRVGELERYVTAAQGAARRAAALTHRLLAFSRRQTLDPRPTDINRLIGGMEDLVRRTVGPRVDVEVVGAGGIWTTLVDPNQLENALLNLCINARDAMPDGGRITIETANKWLDPRAAAERNLADGQYLSLCVTDTGTGMSPEVAARAFDPFFTTKPLGEGTGLGLSMIYGFARQSNGQVRIYSEVGDGTTVCLYLPRFIGEAEELEIRTATPIAQAPPSGKTVLVVDDEPTIRMLVAEVLQDLGYAAIEAGDGQVALKVLESKASIDLLITDVGLPGSLNGRQVADAARALRPALKVLFITGYAENAVIGNGRLDPGMELVTKPFAMDALGDKIRMILAG